MRNIEDVDKKGPPRHGNENMNMSMDKPIALNSAEGTRGPQVKKCKNDVKKDVPGHGNENMNMSMDKPIALNRTEATRRPQLESAKN